MELLKKDIIAVIVLVFLLLGIGLGVYLSQHRTAFKPKAAPAANVEITLPDTKPQKAGPIVIYATSKTTEETSKVIASFNVDESSNYKSLKVTRIKPDQVSLTGVWDATEASAGEHSLHIHLFSLSTAPPSQIGQLVVPVKVSR